MINSTLCYIERDGQYLMLHRTKKEHDLNRDKWIGVGGKLEEGESPDECLLREVREETGLTLTEYRLRGIITFTSDVAESELMFLYTATAYTGSLITCNEGDLEWVPISQVAGLPTWEGDHYFLDRLTTTEEFFSMKLTYEGDHLVQVS